jgi:MFS family permease
VGSAIGGIAALGFLDTSVFAKDVGWRLAFAVGALLGLCILLVRRTVPESPRWLFIHGATKRPSASSTASRARCATRRTTTLPSRARR